MEFNLHQIEIFLRIARERSFSKAAASLRISQPSVSIQIKNLEEALGVRLFERLTRDVRLTREGQMVFECAKKLSGLISGLRTDLDDLKGVGRGQLSAGCARVLSATIVPLAVARFKRKYPDTEVLVKTARSDEVEQWVLENEVDLGVVVGDPASGLIQKELCYEEELVLVLSPRHRLVKKRELSWQQIMEEPFLLQASGSRPTFIERVFAEKGITIKKRVTLGSRDAVKAAISAGFGVSILPRSVVDKDARAGFLKVRKLHDLDIKYPVNIIYRKDKQFSHSALAFLEILRKYSTYSNVLLFSYSGHKGKSRLVS